MAINNAVNANQAGVQCLTSAGVWNGRTITAGTGISVTNGDGVSGNPTISATGSSGGLGTVVVYDDFLGIPNASGPSASVFSVGNANLTVFTASTGSGVSAVTGTSTNPGIIQIAAGVVNARTTIYGNRTAATFDAADFALGNGQITCEWIVRLNQLSNGTQRFLVSLGLGNNVTDTAAPIDGCYFSYVDNVNSGNWTIQNTKAGAGTSSADSGVAANTSFNTFKVIVNAAGTSASYYINGTQVSNSPIATNVPTAPVGFFCKIIKTVGSNGVNIDIDYLNFNWTMTTPRSG